MNDIVPGARVEGLVGIDGKDIYAPSVDVVDLRRRVGMVFQKSNPFPKSIFDNVAYGLRIQPADAVARRAARPRRDQPQVGGTLGRGEGSAAHVGRSPSRAGQQQRLCIARALAVEPEILLMDEPASALDPIATQRIEELIYQLKSRYTIVIVTHNMQQAARVSDVTAFFWLGKLIVCGRTNRIFTAADREAHGRLRDGKVRLMTLPEQGVRHFQEELEQLKARLLEMGGLAKEQVRMAVKGLVDRDRDLIARVSSADGPLNALHIEVRQPLLHAARALSADWPWT